MLVSKLFAKDFPNLFEKKNKNNKKNPPKKQHILLLAIQNNNHKLVLSNISKKTYEEIFCRITIPHFWRQEDNHGKVHAQELLFTKCTCCRGSALLHFF